MSSDIMYYSQGQTPSQGYAYQNPQQQQARPAFGSIQHQQSQEQEQPCGASFGFDGKLVQYFNVKREIGIGELPTQRLVTISKVVTLPEFVARSDRLDYALESGNLSGFCEEKAQQVHDGSESKIWQFLQASFSPTPNQAYLSMLGFDSNELFSKLHHELQDRRDSESLTDDFVTVGRGVPDGYVGSPASQNGNIETDSEHKIDQGQDRDKTFIDIPVDESVEGLINQALLSGNTELAVDFCLLHSRWEDALILASTGSQELIKKTQLKYFQKRPNDTSSMIVAVVTRDLRRLVEHCDLRCWKEALATALTYSDPLGFPYLAETLGRRLDSSDDESLKKCALLCYICCGHINHLVDSWTSEAIGNAEESDKPEHLQDVVEQLMVLKKVGGIHGRESSHLDRILSEKLVKYGSLLVSQGSLKIALKYISDSTDPSIMDLKHRVEYLLGMSHPDPVAPAGRQARSRQTSESSKYPMNKRPSYQIPGAAQMSPGLATSSYDRRTRTSSYVEPNMNISALTGPLISPQSTMEHNSNIGSSGGYFNPLNVNTTMTSPTHTIYGQQTPNASSYVSGSTYSSYNPDRRPSTGTIPFLPGASSVAPGWNDPPVLKAKPKPAVATQPAVEAIKHPIFGSAAPEAQPVYTPYGGGGGDAYSSNTLLRYAPPTGRPGPPSTPSLMQTPYGNPPSTYNTQPTFYPQTSTSQYQYAGMPPPPSIPYMSSPPSMPGSSFNVPQSQSNTSLFQPTPTAGYGHPGGMPPPSRAPPQLARSSFVSHQTMPIQPPKLDSSLPPSGRMNSAPPMSFRSNAPPHTFSSAEPQGTTGFLPPTPTSFPSQAPPSLVSSALPPAFSSHAPPPSFPSHGPPPSFASGVPLSFPSHAPPPSFPSYAPPTSFNSSAPPTSFPSTAPPTPFPSTAPPTSFPSTAPPTFFPSHAPPTSFPSTAPPTSFPSHAPPTSFNSSAPPSSFPSTAPPTSFPSHAPPTSFNSSAPPASFPSTAPPTSFPSHAPPTSFPSTAPPTSFPSHAPPTSFPSQAPPSSFPSHPPPTSYHSNLPTTFPSSVPPSYIHSNAPQTSFPSSFPLTSFTSSAPVTTFPSKAEVPPSGTLPPTAYLQTTVPPPTYQLETQLTSLPAHPPPAVSQPMPVSSNPSFAAPPLSSLDPPTLFSPVVSQDFSPYALPATFSSSNAPSQRTGTPVTLLQSGGIQSSSKPPSSHDGSRPPSSMGGSALMQGSPTSSPVPTHSVPTTTPAIVPLEDQFSSVSLNSPAPQPPFVEEALPDYAEFNSDPTAPPVTAFGPPFAPPSDEALMSTNSYEPFHNHENSNANPFLNQSYATAVDPVTPIYTTQKTQPAPPIPSGPDPSSMFDINKIPAEHQILPKIFEELRSACYNNAQPQVKRKLEDIGRKLEILSEKLREGSLSAKTLSSMHNMVEALQNKDYQLALGIHTQLVTSGNFSEISSFLPAIKALIQTAAQLGVYI